MAEEIPVPLFKVMKHDNMTGWDRYLDNMASTPWSGTFTRAQAEESVTWRQKHSTGRYSYQILPLKPYMTDDKAARERHAVQHGPWRVTECADPDCIEMTARQRRAEVLALAEKEGRP